MEVLAAVDDHRLAGDEVGGRRAEEDDRTDDVLGHLVALDACARRSDTSRSFSITSGCDFTPSDIVKPGATQFTWIESRPSSFASARVNATIAPFDVT